jgi:rubrerythrin
MSPPGRECLPLDEVMNTVRKIDSHVESFYQSAHELTSDDEVKKAFLRLLTQKRESRPTVERVCESIACGDKSLETASQDDLDFLSAIAETSFFRHAGKVEDLADPSLKTSHLVDNALKLEKDLMLFYTKLFGVSCAEHRPVFSELLQLTQRQIAELNAIRARLQRMR